MATATKKTVSVTTVTSKTGTVGSSGTPAAAPKTGSKRTPPGDRETRASDASSTSSESKRSGRSSSPTLMSRLQEKTELATLNDRLANYIEKVRQLELENSRLSRVVDSQETTVRTEVTGIKGLYEEELAAIRKLLDEVSNEKAKLLVEIGRLKSEVDDLREKLRAKEAEAADANGRSLSAEARLKELQLKLKDAEGQRARAEAQNEKLTKDCDSLKKSLDVAKRQLEDETVARVDLENRCQSLKEELEFLRQVHDQEMNESITRTRVVVNEVDDRLKVEYDNRLKDALRQVRDEMDDQLQAIREESDLVLQKRLAEASAARVGGDNSYAELRTTRAQLSELQSQLNGLKNENAAYDARIQSLEDQLRREQDSHQADVDALNADLRRQRALLDDQLQEFKDLMDVKIRLDAEISAYRKMLESEESRISDINKSSQSFHSTPGSSKKRKLLEDESFATPGRHTASSIAQSDVVTKSLAKDVVIIVESSPEGQFVKLLNTSDEKDVTLGGWQLRQTANKKEITYKFPRNYELKSQQQVSVWSGNSDSSGVPASDLRMKNQNWLAGDEVLLELLSQKGEKMASLETKRSAFASTPLRHEFGMGDSAKKVEQPQSASRWRKWSPFNLIKK